MSEQCTSCFHGNKSITSSGALSRRLALSRFIALQGNGHAPAMCEAANGQYTVCFNAAERPLELYRPGAARPMALAPAA